MKIVVAPDSFKGTISASKAAAIIAGEFRSTFPNADVIELPMADGGEGTTEALVSAAKGEFAALEVEGPLGDPVIARYGLINDGKTAIMEMAEASGIELIPAEKLNPMITSTFGVGQLIKDAIEKGVREIIIGIGGSATVDGGTGMAQALGFELTDKNGDEVPRGGASLINIKDIKSDKVIPQLKECTIKVACDVTNPLSGTNGAAKIYGPQKGASEEMVELLENGLCRLFSLISEKGILEKGLPGDGAAGGLGMGLRAFCDAELTSGAELICDAVKLDENLKSAVLIITGEGRTDSQTLSGKLCKIISQHAGKAKVPILLISGALTIKEELFDDFNFAVSASAGHGNLEEMLRDAEKDLRFCAANCSRMLKKELFEHT